MEHCCFLTETKTAESRLKDKRILQILFAGRILWVLSGKRKSAAAPENRSSCKGGDSI